jgi:glycosyltransferase involved in cell wall biosynthesis
MPEVADGAAILFDPHSSTEIGRAIRDVLVDSELRARLERLGTQRAAQFSWEKAARSTLEVYYDVAGAADGAEKGRMAMRARVSR